MTVTIEHAEALLNADGEYLAYYVRARVEDAQGQRTGPYWLDLTEDATTADLEAAVLAIWGQG
ncbi:hypothetical protein [Microcystis phage Mae-JY24]